MYNKASTIARLTVIFALFVILFGAYTRLKDAGLGCPDWPGCYGSLIVNEHAIEPGKAWIEMLHRYVAGTLGLLILYLTYRVRFLGKVFFIATLCCLLVIFQAALGMWTVTLKLYPLVVMGHFLGGISILGLLWVIDVMLSPNRGRFLYSIQGRNKLNLFALLSLIILILQLAAGAWTSATYSALACHGFPQCNGLWWPSMDLAKAFNFMDIGLKDSPGIQIDHLTQVAVHMIHRIGAVITSVFICITSYLLITTNRLNVMHNLGYRLIALLVLQLILGVINVMYGLPIYISLAHTAVAALLFLTLISLILRLHGQVNRN